MGLCRKTRLTQEQTERISRAVADPRRFAMLQQIAAAKACTQCSALDAHQELSPATISHHLKELQEAGLVDVAREGRTAQLTLRRDVWDAYVAHLSHL